MIENNSKKIVALGLSGGVDSSVAAQLLKEQGYEVVGIFMRNWSDSFALKNNECPWIQDQEDARMVAGQLGIDFQTMHFEKEYKEKVLDYFFREYAAGRTPNPDIMCNSEIKFKVFFEKALSMGADYIATGHYARVVHEAEQSTLLKGIDTNKDQSYFLYAIDQGALQKTLFPIGEYEKKSIRELAKKYQLATHDKKDSQGICFVGEVDMRQFLGQYIQEKPGSIIDIDTNQLLGEHQGLAWYTIGQRKGMSVGGTGLPMYVVKKDLQNNILYVAKGNYNPALYEVKVVAQNLHWLNRAPEIGKKYSAKIRYRQTDQKCTITHISDDHMHVEFEEKQRAVTPGQSIVIYEADTCLGGGILQ